MYRPTLLVVTISLWNRCQSKNKQESFSTSIFLHLSPTTMRPESPKSDTEYELDKSLQQAVMKKKERPGWRWKWGEFPRLFFSSSSRKNASAQKKPSELNEGIYLDDIATNKCLDPSLYLIQV